MKTVLVFCISSNVNHYPMLARVATETWDSIPVEGVQTRFYVGGKPVFNHPQMISVNAPDDYWHMGQKDLLAFEWALSSLKWDYMARVNSSCFVHKARLRDAVQSMPDTRLFRGIGASGPEGRRFLWGGMQYVISRDVIQAFVDNKAQWNHKHMEDVAMSFLAADLGFPLDIGGKGSSIDARNPGNWMALLYGGEYRSFEFTDMCDFWQKAPDQYFVRVKQDLKPNLTAQVMRQLHTCLSR